MYFMLYIIFVQYFLFTNVRMDVSHWTLYETSASKGANPVDDLGNCSLHAQKPLSLSDTETRNYSHSTSSPSKLFYSLDLSVLQDHLTSRALFDAFNNNERRCYA